MDNNQRAKPARPLARHYTTMSIAHRHPRLFVALRHGANSLVARHG